MKTLDDFAPTATPSRLRKTKIEWRPPELTDLALGRVLAFDPSLSATGCVDMEVLSSGLVVHGAQTFIGGYPQELTGWAKNFSVAEDLYWQVHRYLESYWGISGLMVIHETPPMIGSRSPESAIMAGLVIRRAALDCRLPVGMVAPQLHKRLTGGHGNAKKKDHHDVLKPLLETLCPGSTKIITNEAQRDAASVALADMLMRRGIG